MKHTVQQQGLLTIAAFALQLFVPATALAATQDVQLVLRPHCEGGYETPETAVLCTTFEVQDPQTLKTPPLKVGDVVDIDVVVDNPSSQPIDHVRVWLSYDPNVLTGSGLTINEVLFPTLTPGEADIVPTEGLIKIDANATAASHSTSKTVFVARIQFRVTTPVTPGTALSFYDVQPGGHTVVTSGETADNVLQTTPPGALFVAISQEQASASSTSSASTSSASSASSTSTACTQDSECPSTICYQNSCQAAGFKIPNGGACRTNEQCANNTCANGICSQNNSLQQVCVTDDQCNGGTCTNGTCQTTNVPSDNHTAFELLQIRNLRVTTEGSTVYSSWQDLQSSQLKAYNVYYGTTSGQYIQRKTIPAGTPSVTLRNLPTGTTYYFAVRAVNNADQESAFSQEVSVEVGNPSTSTAPLSASMFTDAPGQNPIGNSGNVPGETGLSSVFAVLVLISALAGTYIAFRRQNGLVHTTVHNG